MRHLPRPCSLLFRVVTALALMAWTALAFSAVPPARSAAGCAPGAVMSMAMDSAHVTAPAKAPVGQPDCCHPGCHCLAPFGVDVVVLRALGYLAPRAQPAFAFAAPQPVVATAAPPLRPPIA